MLSKRATTSASDLDIPWRYVDAGPRGHYDPETNPTGIITQFTSAENYLVQEELAQYVRANIKIHGQTLGYSYSTAGGEELPKVLAAHLNEYWKPWKPLSGAEIKITGAATALHEILGFSIADTGQGTLDNRASAESYEADGHLQTERHYDEQAILRSLRVGLWTEGWPEDRGCKSTFGDLFATRSR